MQLDGKLRTIIQQLVQEGVPLRDACREFENKYVNEAIKFHGGNLARVAQSLGIHRNTLYNRMKALSDQEKKDLKS